MHFKQLNVTMSTLDSFRAVNCGFLVSAAIFLERVTAGYEALIYNLIYMLPYFQGNLVPFQTGTIFATLPKVLLCALSHIFREISSLLPIPSCFQKKLVAYFSLFTSPNVVPSLLISLTRNVQPNLQSTLNKKGEGTNIKIFVSDCSSRDENVHILTKQIKN